MSTKRKKQAAARIRHRKRAASQDLDDVTVPVADLSDQEESTSRTTSLRSTSAPSPSPCDGSTSRTRDWMLTIQTEAPSCAFRVPPRPRCDCWRDLYVERLVCERDRLDEEAPLTLTIMRWQTVNANELTLRRSDYCTDACIIEMLDE